MRAVAFDDLKNRLSECIRLVAAGEGVLITDRDRVVAEIVPPPPRAGRSALLSDTLLADAVREGLITPAALPPGDPPPRRPVALFKDLMEELERDREDQ
jgi:antitoxin (DNA-binding transcriptional repressor) of toxin-antitoxin stability system